MRSLFICLLLSTVGYSQLPESSVGATITTIESKILGYDYAIWVNLPEDYDSTQSYPVIYVLDSEWRFDITRALVRELAINDNCPQHIIVGIPQIDQKHRFKNLTFGITKFDQNAQPDPSNFWNEERTGGGKRFLNFLEQEVASTINSSYNTNGFDILMGHSLGGYFAAYAILESSFFEAYQIYDPSIWYNKAIVVDEIRENLPADYRSSIFVAQAQGGMPRDSYFLQAVDSLSALLEKYQGIRSMDMFYEKEYHNSMYMYAVIDGMKFLYDGFDFGFIAPTDTLTADDYTNHFKRFSEKVNFTFHPKKDGFRWVGYANHHQKNWKEALKCYALCEDKFRDDPFFLTEVATCHEALGETKKALVYYQRVLTIEPNNATAQAKIKSLK